MVEPILTGSRSSSSMHEQLQPTSPADSCSNGITENSLVKAMEDDQLLILEGGASITKKLSDQIDAENETHKLFDELTQLVDEDLDADRLLQSQEETIFEQEVGDSENEALKIFDKSTEPIFTALREMLIAVKTEDVKSQHYELPTSFFKLVLGEHLKYNCCLFSDKSSTLEDAEKAMLELYCKRTKLENGPTVLDIGCGWGSLSLYIAEKYSNCKVTGICNSVTQKAFIEEQCKNRQLENVEIIVADISIFEMEASYNRIFSIEMFEHMKNYRDLLKKISMWLKSDGLLFVHYFCHKAFAYHFEDVGEDDWVDGILMFIFDPGGGFSPQMDCDVLKFDNCFQLSNDHMPLIVCDMCVMVGENNLPGVNASFRFTAEYVSMLIKDDDSYMKRIWNNYDHDQISCNVGMSHSQNDFLSNFVACEEIFFACEEILIRYSLAKACMVDLGFHQCDAYVNMLFLFTVTWYNLDIVESILLIHDICIQRYHGMYVLDGRMQACTATVRSHKCDVNGYLLVLLAASSAHSCVALYNIDVVMPITPSVTRGQVIQQLIFFMKAYSIMALLKVEDSARHLVDRVVITQGKKGVELFLKKPE